jgi:hypothetical protein
MGAVRYSDKKRVIDFVPKGDGNNFYLTLKVLYQEVKNEWISQGNALEALIVVGEEARLTSLEQLRKSPTRKSAPSLVNALNRLVTIRALDINKLDVGKIPPIRFKTLSKTAFTLRAQAIARMSTARKIATLVAWARCGELCAFLSWKRSPLMMLLMS